MQKIEYILMMSLLLLIGFNLNMAEAQVIVHPLFSCTEKLDNSYGLCSHISRVDIDWKLRNQSLSYARKVDIGNIRTDFDYSTLVHKGSFYPNIIDSVFASAKVYGCNILPIISYRGKVSANEYDHVYLKNILSHYGTDIPYIELANEPNLNIKVSDYLNYMKRTYQYIKRNNTSKVLIGGLAEITSYLDTLSRNKAYQYFDIMNFHTYKTPENLVFSLQALHDNMTKYNWSKPVWITETGCSTIPGTYNLKFYTSILPIALKNLGINSNNVTLGIVADAKYYSPPSIDIINLLSYFKEIKYLKFSDLKKVSKASIPVIIPSFDEYYPAEYEDDLVTYVKGGGTIICPRGVPFYYCTKNKKVSNRLQTKLHMNFIYWWEQKNVPENPVWFKVTSGYDKSAIWSTSDNISCRYISDAKLQRNDQLIPIITAGNSQFTGNVEAIYKLNSDLKGNIIVNTCLGSMGVSEEEQARRLPRTYLIAFAYGVDKVFWYHLRAFENNPSSIESYFGIIHKDFSPKLAYKAYSTLIAFCPSKSTRPIMTITKDSIYQVAWRDDKGVSVIAYWQLNPVKEKYIARKMNTRLYNIYGEEIKASKVKLSSSIIYEKSN